MRNIEKKRSNIHETGALTNGDLLYIPPRDCVEYVSDGIRLSSYKCGKSRCSSDCCIAWHNSLNHSLSRLWLTRIKVLLVTSYVLILKRKYQISFIDTGSCYWKPAFPWYSITYIVSITDIYLVDTQHR